jgi:hypothetical protein
MRSMICTATALSVWAGSAVAQELNTCDRLANNMQQDLLIQGSVVQQFKTHQ